MPRTPTEDADGDGFAPADIKHCIPLEVEPDCADGDARAFPGQTEFFVGAVCPAWHKSCHCTANLFCHPTTDTQPQETFICIVEDAPCGELSEECRDCPDQVTASFDFSSPPERSLARIRVWSPSSGGML